MHWDFDVEPEIFEHFPGMHLVVAIVEDLDNTAPRPAVSRFWSESWTAATSDGLEDARKHPHVEAWRRDFAALGVSMKRFPTSIEALLRRALRGGEVFTINPLVDFYNALSVRYVHPVGAFDLGALSAPIALRRTRDQDRFTALDADEDTAVPPGEIAYASGESILTRHFMWRQSRLALVGAHSRDVFLVSEIPGVAGADAARQMHDAMVGGLRELFERECQSFVMHAQSTRIEWR